MKLIQYLFLFDFRDIGGRLLKVQSNRVSVDLIKYN